MEEHDAERKNIGLHGRGAAAAELGRAIHLGAARAARGGDIQVGAGDAESVELGGIERAAAAEIGQDDGRVAGGIHAHQHVGRFQILVQHAHGMGRRQRVGDLRHQVQAQRHGQRADAALAFRPIGQIAALGVDDFEEVGRFLQIPVGDADQVVTLAEAFAQQAAERDFAAQAGQAGAVLGEFDDAALAGFDLLGEPGVAESAGAEAFNEAPVWPVRHGVARVEGVRGRQAGAGVRRRFDGDRFGEAVAVAVHGMNDGVVGIAQGAAQAGHAFRQRGFGDVAIGPEGGDDFVLGDDFAGVGEQQGQQFERPAFEINLLTGHGQHKAGSIEAAIAKAPAPIRPYRMGNLVGHTLGISRCGTPQKSKVFCFFFSKKKFFLERKNQRTFACWLIPLGG